jgi:uncharacterized membrane protein YgaE (UPF0421/DUF939 family)
LTSESAPTVSPRRIRLDSFRVGGLRTPARPPLLQVLKTAIAAIAAWLICSFFLHESLPIFAAIAALLVVQPSVSQSFTRGVERSIGVIVGVALAYGVGVLFGSSSWVVLTVIVVALLLAWAFRLSPGSSNQIPISAMLVLAIGAQTPGYAYNRIIETVVGAVIGLVINAAIVPPVLLAPAHRAVQKLLVGCAGSLENLAEALSSAQDSASLDRLLTEARALRGARSAAESAVAAGEDSLTMNPRRGRHRRVLQHDIEMLARLSALVTRILGMARAVHDHYDDELRDDPTVRDISRELRRASHDLRLLGRDVEGTSTAPTTEELPTLTAPLLVTRPHPTQWILIGSLLEDMRRVREEIVGSEDR